MINFENQNFKMRKVNRTLLVFDQKALIDGTPMCEKNCMQKFTVGQMASFLTYKAFDVETSHEN